MTEERYQLAVERISSMKKEATKAVCFQEYFHKTAQFLEMIDELVTALKDGSYEKLDMDSLRVWNHRLYFDIMPEQYEESYANPDFAVLSLGEKYGQILSFLYAEVRGAIVYAFEEKTECLDILFELFIEIYNEFEMEEEPDIKALKDIIYWYASDYSDVFSDEWIKVQVLPERSAFPINIIMNSDLNDLRYLYRFGEYISDNEILTAMHLNQLDESIIKKMADAYTEGFRIGFINTGKDLSKKKVVNIRYTLGFERVIRKAIDNFEEMGLKATLYRASVTALTKRQHMKSGYFGAAPNKQYDYDHRDDQALFLDKKYMERKLSVIQAAYEACKDAALEFAGPAVTEVFGEEPFTPIQKEHAIKLTKRQQALSLEYDSRSGQLVNDYIPGDERSYTIIAYPVPEIGKDYAEIFNEVIRINTLDANLYEQVQQTLIDALDQGEYVHILGRNGNKTDLKVQLWKLQNPNKETIFENCVADVNIPVGEVFTSPSLEGTNGVLHVSKVYLRDLQYKDFEITFANGMIADYNCKNFERELDNKRYIKDNILKNHETLPMGEFAIGTNTTAYVVAKKYEIEDKLPILIAEKMGPHFAVGDTCYSWSEDVKVYNQNGKEIVARDNAVSLLRKEDVSKAYYHCHTDITIPYDELASITVVTGTGERIVLLQDGEFVLRGTEILNEPLKNYSK